MPILLLIVGLALAGSALHLRQDQRSEWRPIREVTTAPTIEEFELGSFSFELPGIYHALTAHYGSIEGEPTIGVRYGVEASIGGERYIASATFELLDVQGRVVQEIPMVLEHTGVAGSFRFVGLLTVPPHPFRVQVRAVGVDGRRFLATYLRRFEPVRTPPEPGIPRTLGLPFDLTDAYQKRLRDAEAEREESGGQNRGAHRHAESRRHQREICALSGRTRPDPGNPTVVRCRIRHCRTLLA
jgi:hypothetical protein